MYVRILLNQRLIDEALNIFLKTCFYTKLTLIPTGLTRENKCPKKLR